MRLELGNLQLFGIDFGRAWGWWRSGLHAAFTPWAPEVFCRPSPTVRIEWNESEFRFFRVGSDTTTHFATLTATELELAAPASLRGPILADGWKEELIQVELRLPSHLVMQRVLDMPAIDRASLRQMLVFQLARLTPFPAEKLYYDALIDEAVPEPRQGNVHVAAVPRDRVDPVLLQLESVTGVRVSSLSFDSAEATCPFNLFGGRRVPSRWWRRLNINSLMLLVLLGSLVVAATAPVLNKREQVLERKAEIDHIYANVSATMQARTVLEEQLQTLNFLLSSRPDSTLTEVLSELSEVVPDGISLSDLRIQRDTITISGVGTGVVDLIELLNDSPLFDDARLTSSVTRNPRTGQDQFNAALTLANKGPE